MKMEFKDLRKWGLQITVMMIISLHLTFSEAATSSTTGRSLLQTEETLNTSNQEDGTVRVDPLHYLKKYRGGYDITNKHYWSSVVFTGVFGYAIALLWLIVGAIYSLYLLATASCSTNTKRLTKRRPCQKQCFLCPLVLTTVFVVLAIIGATVASGATSKFHARAKTIVGVIIDTADQASNTIYNATGAIKKISETLQSNDGVGDYGADAATFLDSTSHKLDDEAGDIERQARKNRHLVGKGLTILYLLTTITISLNLASVIALAVFGVLRFRRVLHMLIMLCWLLTIFCWLLFGGYYFLEKFSGDTCTALQDFQQNPDNSSLSSILPCDELLSAKSILLDIGVGISDIVFQVNANISLLRSNSFPELHFVCDPFSGPPDYMYQPEKCPTNTIRIGDIPQVLRLFTCSETSGAGCKEGEFITTSEYNAIDAYTTSIQSLLDAYPEMESLVDCRSVKNAFSDILINHCKPLKRDVKMIWIAVLLLSTVTLGMTILWASTTHHEQKHHFTNGSVKPSAPEANSMDPEAAYRL